MAASPVSVKTKIAFIGCGFFSAHYGDTLPNHPELEPVAAFDIIPARAEAFSKRYNIPIASSLQAILDDPQIDIIINLVAPASHVEVARAALLAGKHVYTDKPLALEPVGAKELVDLAAKKNLVLAVAPCNHLGGSMQTLARLIKDGAVGTPRLVYAEIDDGPIHRLDWDTWKSNAGALWPAETEFRLGCVWEHAGYALGVLTNMFGPATSVTSFSDVLHTHKMDKLKPEDLGADFSVALIRFKNGTVARLTVGTVARRDRTMTVVGDDGILHVPEIWDDEASIQFTLPRATTKIPSTPILSVPSQNGDSQKSNGVPSSATPEQGIQVDTLQASPRHYPKNPRLDLCLGVAELAAAIREKRRSRMDAKHAFHVFEILQALNDSVAKPGCRELSSTFEPIEFMPPLETAASHCTISW